MLVVAPPLISKLSATGNDFLIVQVDTPILEEQWKSSFARWPRAQVAQRLCNRHEGIGADGMLFMLPAKDADWAWEFYNQDGSRAEMCGNAARCAGLWAARQTGAWRKFRFLTPAGPVSAERTGDGRIEVTMPAAKLLGENLALDMGGKKVQVDWVNSGVPHALVITDNLAQTPEAREFAARLRRHSHFGSAGANVTFFSEQSKDHISAMTFERGVEDFTLACGTGAVAAAFRHGHRSGEKVIRVDVPGGRLDVNLAEGTPKLIGPAHWIADMQVHVHEDGVLVP